jgi:mono/diheme cytochrome c family protein
MKYFKIAIKIISSMLLVAMVVTAQAAPDDPTLTLNSGAQKLVFKRSELWTSPDIETIQVSVEGKSAVQSFRAIRLSRLLAKMHLQPSAVIQFKCADGYSAVISKERLLSDSAKASRAYLAIEPADQKWPSEKGDGGPSPGPFAVMWVHPELSKITPLEWPNQVVSFEVKGALENLYPKITPGASASAAVRKGFDVFVKNCFMCHTLNQQGDAQIGPDLNLPMSPTEYFKAGILPKYIRDPQNLRHWPQAHMPAFPTETLPEQSLRDVIAYLGYMDQHR